MLLNHKLTSIISNKNLRKGTVTLIDQGFVSGTNFITGVVIGRMCSKEEFGLYLLGLSLMLFAVNLQAGVISTPYTVYSPQLKGPAQKKYTGSMLCVQLVLSAIVVVSILLIQTPVFAYLIPAEFIKISKSLSITIFAIMFREFARQIYFSHLRMGAALTLDLVIVIIQLSGLFALIQLSLLTIENVFYVLGTGCLVAGCGHIIHMRHNLILKYQDVIKDLRKNWQFGKWPLAAGVALTLSMQLYPWLLSYFHTTLHTGELAAVMGIANIANPFIIGAANFLGPKVMHGYASSGLLGVERVVLKITSLLFACMVLFCLIMFTIGGPLLQIVYGPDYSHLGIVVGLVAMSLMSDVVTFPHRCGLFALGRPDISFKASSLALGCSLTLGVVLVKEFGVYGVGFGLLSGNLMASGLRWLVYRRQIRAFHDTRVLQDA